MRSGREVREGMGVLGEVRNGEANEARSRKGNSQKTIDWEQISQKSVL